MAEDRSDPLVEIKKRYGLTDEQIQNIKRAQEDREYWLEYIDNLYTDVLSIGEDLDLTIFDLTQEEIQEIKEGAEVIARLKKLRREHPEKWERMKNPKD